MKPVLLATDGSPTAERATGEAIELARVLGAPLVVVTSWELVTSVVDVDSGLSWPTQVPA